MKISTQQAIEMLERFQNPEPWEPEITDRAYEALQMAISALEKQSRIITVTDAEGGLLASISDKDIIEENGVHVIISEE